LSAEQTVEIVLATLALDHPGGIETYLLTIAPQLERLGHEVTLHSARLGAVADLARDRGLRVVGSEAQLPDTCDAVLSCDAESALVMAQRYPGAVRAIVVHGAEFDICLPPASDGVVSAAIVMNDAVAARVAATAHPPPVTRLRQPIDIAHFNAGGPARPRATRVLLLGNYLRGRELDAVADACARAGVVWRQVGTHGEVVLDPLGAILEADVVVGMGRSALEGMACGRGVWVAGPSASDGWMTPDSYAVLEADGLRGRATDAEFDAEAFVAALADFDPAMGAANRRLAVLHHSPYAHANGLVGVLRAGPVRAPAPGPLREMARLVRTQHDAQARVVGVVHELRALHERHEAVAADRDALAARRDRLTAEVEGQRTRMSELEAQRCELLDEVERHRRELERLLTTRRWRLASLLARPLDRARRMLGVR
jgi:hypothetical protein